MTGPLPLRLQIREKIKHDPMAFTQGLEIFENGFLEGTGQYGRSQVRKLRMDGTTRSKISNNKGDFGEGVTVSERPTPREEQE